jgi:hypothetical protein
MHETSQEDIPASNSGTPLKAFKEDGVPASNALDEE